MPPIIAAPVAKRATLDDLYGVEGKAELIDGKVVRFMASRRLPSRVALRIATSLLAHADGSGNGEGFGDGIGYAVPELPSGRESFSPDAFYYVGPDSSNEMRFVEGPPTFAVEVRSENDYGSTAEADIAAKRADYFAAGTLVVWDVDPLAQRIHAYTATDPARPRTFGPGETADAESAVPGWRLDVDTLWK